MREDVFDIFALKDIRHVRAYYEAMPAARVQRVRNSVTNIMTADAAITAKVS